MPLLCFLKMVPLLYIIEKESYNTNNSQLQKCLVNGGKGLVSYRMIFVRIHSLTYEEALIQMAVVHSSLLSFVSGPMKKH
jgi:hypothetical protein